MGIKIAVIGVGNCVSALIQGIEYYKNKTDADAIGLMHWEIGGYKPGDIEVVAAFDIDSRKVNKDISEAIFEVPNCANVFHPNVPKYNVSVSMGKVLDGISEHMEVHKDHYAFRVSNEPDATKEDVVKILRESNAEILLNYLPVGSEQATRFYAECALEANIAFINNIPVFIASDPVWANKFAEKNIPLVGDDIKSQYGATIVHRVLTDLCNKRGVKLDRTYQLNVGGNTDFLNMSNQQRLESKRISKTEAVQAVTEERLTNENIHVGPSDYIPWLKDNKVCFIRMEGRIFGDVPINLELRLSVEDSPNSAGVAIDTIRCCKVALDRKVGGVLYPVSAFFSKHPPIQYSDDECYRLLEEFLSKSHETYVVN